MLYKRKQMSYKQHKQPKQKKKKKYTQTDSYADMCTFGMIALTSAKNTVKKEKSLMEI